MGKIIQEKIRILSNKKPGRDYCEMTLRSPAIASQAKPGQFVEIKISGSSDPFLRRPLGVHRVKGSTFSVLCEIVGTGTRMLSEKQAGDFVDVVGPLGKGFDLMRRQATAAREVLIAGGMGVAPLVYLAEELAHDRRSTVHAKPLVLIGAKTKGHILCVKEFKNSGCEVKAATDDGSFGFKGRVTDLLKGLLPVTGHRPLTIYACGPKPMLKEVARISKENSIPAQVSLEAHMCCGIGACLGCVVKTKNGLKRVCKEGPVFNADEIVWEEL